MGDAFRQSGSAEPPRFFLPPESIQLDGGGRWEEGRSATFSASVRGEEAHHALRVLRIGEHDPVVLLDGEGVEYHGHVAAVVGRGKDAALLIRGEHITRSPAEPSLKIVLVQGLTKGDKMDQVIQKGTETGATAFFPVTTQRVIVRYDGSKAESRRARWSRIALEAAKQSRRGVWPKVHPIKEMKAVGKELIDQGFDVLVCWEQADTPIKAAFSSVKGPIAFVIGPEGGLTEEEVESLTELGARAVSLGPRVLRTETAGPMACALALYEKEMKGAPC